jgi:2-polyprenyl-3-methyl-5-hydroxy-6-metoxy-1,4-benzoquinol methylase
MMNCPICDEHMELLFEEKQLHVLKCTNNECRFIGLDLETWEYPYSDEDYYTRPNKADINADRPFIRRRARVVRTHCGVGRLAELGCGLGETAIALCETGFDVWGVEESQNAIALLNDTFPTVHWVCSGIEKFLKAENQFHVISMFHVLEHIPYPSGLIPTLKKSLMPKGFLVIELPDVHGGLARLKGKRWEYWLTHHVNYFSNASLKKLLEAYGFREVHTERMFHFGHPQGILWKDTIKAGLARMGLNGIIRTIWQLQ